MTLTEHLEHLLSKLPQKYSVMQLSLITKKSYSQVSSALLYLYERGRIQRKLLNSRTTGRIAYHYWVGRGRP